MRERVAKIAAEEGYVRDPLVSTLMNQLRTRSSRQFEKLAYVSLWNTRSAWKHKQHDQNFYRNLCARAKELGYEVEEFWAREPGMTAKRLTKILLTRGIRGIIVGSMPRPWGHVSLDLKNFAAVAAGPTVLRPSMHRIVSSQTQGMELTLRVLKHRGYRRIAFTSVIDQSCRINQGWLSAYLFDRHFVSRKLQIPPLLLKTWDIAKFEAWIKQHKPEVVLSNSEEPLQFLRKLGISVPDEVGYASLDRIHDTDSYAGVDQLRGLAGVAAVDLLVSLIETNQFGLPEHPKKLYFDCVWREGPTVRPPARLGSKRSKIAGSRINEDSKEISPA